MEIKKLFQEERVVDVELASGYQEECVLYEDIDRFILLIDRGEEDFVILQSADAILQFYGVDDQFIGETRIDLPNGDFRTYELINKEKEQMTQRVQLETPFGVFTPQVRGIVSLEVIRQVVREYYGNEDFDAFVQKIPCIDSTEETKRYMGLKK
ncbi:MAG: hypothetical protein K2N44_12590 [Lachnospiraceae bacterium]|nr:hypothetical protein [Lachnospiraceae bacterium]